MSIFLTGKRTGKYWESLQRAKEIIERLSLDVSSVTEREYENRISGALQPNFPSFIDQRNIQQVMTRVTLFQHDHRPDMSIDKDGIAIEVKPAKGGSSFREAIGQAMIYRLGYRFTIIVWVDGTKDKMYKSVCSDPATNEYKFIKELEEINIFCIVK